MDMADTVAPRSDQMNAEDLLSGPQTFTVKEVRVTGGDQPVSMVLAEFPPGRPFKPSKTVRRLIIAAWGKEKEAYSGRRLTLYRDPDVTFGRDKPGGIRVSHMSHLPDGAPLSLWLTVKKGKRAEYTVQPLGDVSLEVHIANLRNEWKSADPDRKKVIEAEVAALQQPEPSESALSQAPASGTDSAGVESGVAAADSESGGAS